MRFRSRSIIWIASAGFCLLYAAAFSHAQNNALAIFNFRPTNIEAMGYDGEILYALISAMEREKTIKVMSRRAMEEVLFQAGLVQGDNPETVLKAGGVLGVSFILFGNVSRTGGRITSHLSLMDIQGKAVRKIWTHEYSGREDILARIPQVARELSATISSGRAAAGIPSLTAEPADVDIEDLRAKSAGNQVVLTWKFNPERPITGFNMYRAESAEGPFQLHGKTTKNIFQDTQIQRGRAYYYRVGVLLHSGQEVKSRHTAQIKNVGEKIPHPPLILSLTGHVRRMELKFVPSLLNRQERFKIIQYVIYRKSKSSADWEKIKTIDATQISENELAFNARDTDNLEDQENYTYAVSSVDQNDLESLLSDSQSAATVARPTLAAAQDNLLRKAQFSWKPIENVEGYYLYRRLVEGKWLKVAKINTPLQFELTDSRELEDGRDYQYHMTGYDSFGESGPSNMVRVRTKALPSFPVDVMAQSGMFRSVRISWTSLADADVGGYSVYRGSDLNALKFVTKVDDYKSHFYLDGGTMFEQVNDGARYYYAVTSFNLFGAEGPASPAVHATTKPVPANVKGLTVTANPDTISLRWEKNMEPDITGYLLYRSKNNGSWSKIAQRAAGETDYTDRDLSPGATFRYRVVAEDQDGLKSNPEDSQMVASPLVQPKK
ncbi:MAG: fibronectin type III domain-containing protein [Desulfobacterales bacterium]|nr:fibronectin type III domain-containing protein [Desulfobacterales bacterium]